MTRPVGCDCPPCREDASAPLPTWAFAGYSLAVLLFGVSVGLVF